MRNKILLLILGVVVGATATFFFLPKDVEDEVVIREFAEKPASTTEVVEAERVLEESKIKNSDIEAIRRNSPESDSLGIERSSNAKIVVEGTTYDFFADGETSLYELMIELQTRGLVIKTKKFGSLGYLIDGINGKDSRDGYYWTLYINGLESNVGASLYVPKTNDIIEWKYEKR